MADRPAWIIKAAEQIGNERVGLFQPSIVPRIAKIIERVYGDPSVSDLYCEIGGLLMTWRGGCSDEEAEAIAVGIVELGSEIVRQIRHAD